MHFLASSMETALETGLLDDLPPDLLTALTAFVRERQGAKMPISRSNFLFQELLTRHQEFYDALDVGRPPARPSATALPSSLLPPVPRRPCSRRARHLSSCRPSRLECAQASARPLRRRRT